MNFTVLLMVGFMLAAVGVAAALAVSAGRRLAKAHQAVPEVATPAGAGWAGAHSPEARLHRRLGDAREPPSEPVRASMRRACSNRESPSSRRPAPSTSS